MKNNDFEYSYTAPTAQERREIESIRDSYLPKEKTISKLEHLRRLDGRVKEIPLAVSITIGVVGLLIFGLGLSMILEWKVYIWGLIVSFVGLIPMAFAYLVYIRTSKYLKNKYRVEIIRLSDELLNEKANEK